MMWVLSRKMTATLWPHEQCTKSSPPSMKPIDYNGWILFVQCWLTVLTMQQETCNSDWLSAGGWTTEAVQQTPVFSLARAASLGRMDHNAAKDGMDRTCPCLLASCALPAATFSACATTASHTRVHSYLLKPYWASPASHSLPCGDSSCQMCFRLPPPWGCPEQLQTSSGILMVSALLTELRMDWYWCWD